MTCTAGNEADDDNDKEVPEDEEEKEGNEDPDDCNAGADCQFHDDHRQHARDGDDAAHHDPALNPKINRRLALDPIPFHKQLTGR